MNRVFDSGNIYFLIAIYNLRNTTISYLMKTKLNPIASLKAFSLVEVLVAVGILSIISLGMATLFTDMNKQTKETQTKVSLIELKNNLITRISKNPAICSWQVKDKIVDRTDVTTTHASATIIDLGNTFYDGVRVLPTDPLPPPLITVGDKLGNQNVASIQVVDIKGMTDTNPTEYKAKLQIAFTPQASFQVLAPVSITIYLQSDPTDPTKILSCNENVAAGPVLTGDPIFVEYDTPGPRSFTIPAIPSGWTNTKMVITVVGGGGGGGGAFASSAPKSDPCTGGAGGGAGGYKKIVISNPTPGVTMNINVGAGGSPGFGTSNYQNGNAYTMSTTRGNAGSNSTVTYSSQTIVSNGGSGANGSVKGGNAVGGLDGDGNASGVSVTAKNSTGCDGGAGGKSMFAPGGAGGLSPNNSAKPGNVGQKCSGGGGGGGEVWDNDSESYANGARGGDGYVSISISDPTLPVSNARFSTLLEWMRNNSTTPLPTNIQ